MNVFRNKRAVKSNQVQLVYKWDTETYVIKAAISSFLL